MPLINELLAVQPTPVPTLVSMGWPTLDKVMGGFPKAGVWVVTGGPRKGASTVLVEWVGRLALAAPRRC